MPYDSYISRGMLPAYIVTPGAHPLIPEDVQRDLMAKAVKKVVAAPVVKRKSKGARRK